MSLNNGEVIECPYYQLIKTLVPGESSYYVVGIRLVEMVYCREIHKILILYNIIYNYCTSMCHYLFDASCRSSILKVNRSFNSLPCHEKTTS